MGNFHQNQPKSQEYRTSFGEKYILIEKKYFLDFSSDPDPAPAPLFQETDPRIRIRIHIRINGSATLVRIYCRRGGGRVGVWRIRIRRKLGISGSGNVTKIIEKNLYFLETLPNSRGKNIFFR